MRVFCAMLGVLAAMACSEDAVRVVPLRLTPSRVQLPEVAVGSVARASVDLENDGDTAITVRQVVVGALLAEELRVVGVPEQIPGGAIRTVSLIYAPRSPGVRSDVVRFELDGDRHAELVVSARARGEVLRLFPDALDFGPVAVGAERVATVVLELVGSEPLDLSTATVRGGTGFAVRSGFPRELLPGETSELVIAFTPTELGLTRAEVVLGAGPRALGPLRVEGSGVEAEIVLDPGQVDLAGVLVGDRKVQRLRLASRARERHTVTLEPTGDLASFAGLDAVTGTVALEAGEGRELELVFAPREVGPAVLGIAARVDDGPLRPLATLRGLGVADPQRPLRVDPPLIELGALELGYPVERSFWLENMSSLSRVVTGAVRVLPANAGVELRPAPGVPEPMAGHDRHRWIARITPQALGPTVVALEVHGASSELRFEGVARPVDTVAARLEIDLGTLLGDRDVDRRAVELESLGRLDATVSASLSGPSAPLLFVEPALRVPAGGTAWLRIEGPPRILLRESLDATLHLQSAERTVAVRLRGELRPAAEGDAVVCVSGGGPGVEMHVVPAAAALRDVPFAGSRCHPTAMERGAPAWSVGAAGGVQTCARRLGNGDALLIVTTPMTLAMEVVVQVQIRGLVPLASRRMAPGQRWDVGWLRRDGVELINSALGPDGGRCF